MAKKAAHQKAKGPELTVGDMLDLLSEVIWLLNEAPALPEKRSEARALLLAMETLRSAVAGDLCVAEVLPRAAARLNPSPRVGGGC